MNRIGRLFVIASGMVAALIFATTQPEIGTAISTSLAAPSSDASLVARLPSISIEKLPPEAIQTIKLIQQGGPFPYRQDGTVFGNRERRLPIAPYRTYHEYTVPTPGLRTRGARRIVTAPQDTYSTSGSYEVHFLEFSPLIVRLSAARLYLVTGGSAVLLHWRSLS